MLPEDAAVLLAKIIFVVSAAMVLCMARVDAQEIPLKSLTEKVYLVK